MKEKYNFEELKVEISNLSYNKQLQRLVEVKTGYKQKLNPSV